MKKHLLTLIASFAFMAMAFSQNAVLTGKVTDSNGLSLPGATISVAGENKGTVSDNNGSFTMTKLNEGKIKLEISYLG